MAEPITRVTLFIPGAAALAKAKLRDNVETEWIENDGTFGKAFSFGTVEPAVIKKLDAAPGALVLHWTIDLRDGRTQIVSAVQRLRDAGALAVRVEQSKLGWDVAKWLELFSSDDAWAWHRGTVAFLGGDDAMQSCGMHAFSLPDVRVELDNDPPALQEMASLFNVYQLIEDPVIRSGQTFSPDRETPRRLVERWPDVEYPPGHPCHNPYGVWRLGPPGGKARALGELALNFMPPLSVLLTALEQKHGKPLTKKQVEAVRDEGVCIAMQPRDVQKLERERGYSDLDPELAWQQWKLLREH